MASSNADIETRIATLRQEILSYKPGKAVSCDDERVVFPDKLVVGMIDTYSFEKNVQYLAGKVGCMVMLVLPSYIKYYPAWIEMMKRNTGHVPLCAIFPGGDILNARYELKQLGITDMYEVPVPGRIHSDEGQLQWLDLLLGCLQEGDRAFAANDLKKMCTNPQCRLLYDKTKKEAKEANQKMFTEVNERKHETKELERKCEETLASHEGLVKVNSILKSEMVREKEKLQQFEMSLSENEKIAKHAMEMYKQRELELEKKLKSKELHIETIVENLQETEKTARREVERLQTEKDDEKERAEKEKQSLSAEMTKKLASKQQHVDTLTETVREKERNETTLRQQVEELKKGREEDRARAEKDKRSLAADMTKKLESKQQHVDTLTETVGEKERNETTLTKQVEELRKGKEEDRARAEKDIRSIELSWKKEHDSKEQLLEQLEREIWKLRTKIQLESEMRAAEQKKKAETHDWSLIHWMISGKQAQGDKSSFEDNSTGGLGRSDTLQSGEEPPDDEFAGILQQIADDLYDEAQIDSLAGQLGILHGDIQRALMTNMRFNRVTSDGTRHMLKQWRRGVSREDERIELKKALEAAKLVNLADLYLSEGVEEKHIDLEYASEDVNDQQPSNRDETSLEQDRTKGHTDIQVLQEATASSNHTPRDGHSGDTATKTQEDLTDGSRSQHLEQSPERSTEDLDESKVTSEEVSSEEVHPGDDMNNVSSIQPSEQSHSQEMQVLPEYMSEVAPLVSYGGKPNEESATLGKNHFGGIISNEEDLISQLVLTDTSPEKILLIFLVKIVMDASQKAFSL
eukprot:XP_011681422.1 PREDICTED: intracellular protein transport protein USO1-like [Strongylocentrotus purpuratus]